MNIKHQMNRVKEICCTSVDDAKDTMNWENNLSVLDLCLQYEKQHQNRSTMIQNLKVKIRKLEAVNREPARQPAGKPKTGVKRS